MGAPNIYTCPSISLGNKKNITRCQQCESSSIETRVTRLFIHWQECRYECFVHGDERYTVFHPSTRAQIWVFFHGERELHNFPSIDKSVFFPIALKPLDRFHLVTNSLLMISGRIFWLLLEDFFLKNIFLGGEIFLNFHNSFLWPWDTF